MKALTSEEAISWCETHGLHVTARRYLNYQEEDLHSFTIGLDADPSSVIALADHLVPTWKDASFGGSPTVDQSTRRLGRLL